MCTAHHTPTIHIGLLDCLEILRTRILGSRFTRMKWRMCFLFSIFQEIMWPEFYKNNTLKTIEYYVIRINLFWLIILDFLTKNPEKWLEIGNFDDSIRIFIFKWRTFFLFLCIGCTMFHSELDCGLARDHLKCTHSSRPCLDHSFLYSFQVDLQVSSLFS